jgi:hypothetical protein
MSSEEISCYAPALFTNLQGESCRVPNPEISGGYIALVATNNNRVPLPPSSLERMQACLRKEVAFNRSILMKENQVLVINADVANFLQGISADPNVPLVVCVNTAENSKHAQPTYGQLWLQEERQMTVSGKVREELDQSQKSIALTGVHDALDWRHVMERSGDQKPGQRVVIYQKCLDKLDIILASGYTEDDTGGGRKPVYEKILEMRDTWQDSQKPVLLPKDSPHVASWAGLA